MAVTKVEYDIDQPFDVTQLNDIGPTKNLTFRNNSDLPYPSARSDGTPDFDTINVDNDAATIYLDPDNGNDSNGGTDLSSDAVQTLTRAWVVLTPARPNLHIESTTGTDWTLSQNWTSVTANSDVLVIQCAAGQIGTIISTDYTAAEGAFPSFANHKLRAWDGIIFQDARTDFSVFSNLAMVSMRTPVLDPHVKHCDIEAYVRGVRTITLDAATTTITIEKNIIRQKRVGGPDSSDAMLDSSVPGTTITANVKNNILIGILGEAKTAVFMAVGNLNMDHNTILNCENMIEHSIRTTQNLHSNIIQNVSVLSPTIVIPPSIPLSMTNSLINASSLGGIDVSSETNLFDLDPLFIDQASETATGLQLFHVGRTTSDGTSFPLNSPAVGIGLSDAGAWDFTYVAAAETLKAFELLVIDGYKFTAIQERLNYQAFTDIQGRFHNVWDDVNWKIPFNFEGNYWQGHDQTMNFNGLFLSKTFLRYFPEGDDGLWGTGGIVITVNTATQIDTGTNIPPRILPDGSTLAGSDQLIPNALRGFIINITWTDSGAKSGFFEILNHDESEINLEHIRGDSDITSGSGFMANVLYLPVLLDMGSVSYWNEYGTENEINGVQQVWMPQGNVTIEGTSSAEFHFREFTLRQTREEPLT